MGKIRRGGFVFIWWTGDHTPRHVHVFNGRGKLLGRVAIASKEPLDDWMPPRKVVGIIDDLQKEGRI